MCSVCCVLFVLDSGWGVQSSGADWDHSTVSPGKTLYSHSAFIYRGAQMGTDKLSWQPDKKTEGMLGVGLYSFQEEQQYF